MCASALTCRPKGDLDVHGAGAGPTLEEEAPLLVAALTEVLDPLGLSLHATICRSPVTREVLNAWARGDAAGLRAYRRASAASQIHPPDLPELTWRSSMGSVELAAYGSCAAVLERALVGGDLVPGRPDWTRRRRQLLRAHLTSPRLVRDGQTWLEAVTAERLEAWLDPVRWPAEPADPRPHRRAPPPAGRRWGRGDDGGPAPLRWLLE